MPNGADSTPNAAKEIVDKADPLLLKTLPPEQREQVIRIVQQVASSFEGPLPPPLLLSEYDRIIPNGAERLMKLLEE